MSRRSAAGRRLWICAMGGLLSVSAMIPANADLTITLRGIGVAPPAPARKPVRPPSKPSSRGGANARSRSPQPLAGRYQPVSLSSRGGPIGITRRGAPPVLPSAEGVLDDPAAAGPEVAVNAQLGRVAAPSADVYRVPDVRGIRIGSVPRDQQLAVTGQWQGWVAIIMSDGSPGFLPQAHVEMLPYRVKSVIPTAPPEPGIALADYLAAGSALDAGVRSVLEEAFRCREIPYVWGGVSDRGLDCSGMVLRCFRQAGFNLPRTAAEQAGVGQPVSFDQLQAGDRIYFSVKRRFDHTGIYLGNGYFIHASRSRGKVGVDHLTSPLYGRSLSAARRL